MQVHITRWIDGDTFAGGFTRVYGPERRFRLMNCWAPERGQVGFVETVSFVVTTFGNGSFDVDNTYIKSDRYGRLVVDLRLDLWNSMSSAINEFVESRGYPRGRGWPGQSVP